MAPKEEPREAGREFEYLAPRPERNRFGYYDVQILDSGSLADITVLYADYAILCHRAFLANCSGWFNDRIKELDLLPPPQDGNLPSIHIHGYEPDDIHAMLVFIYAGAVDPRARDNFGNPTEPVIPANLRLYNLGFEFRVTGLSDFASDAIGRSLSTVLKWLCSPILLEHYHADGCTELRRRLHNIDFMRIFKVSLKAAHSIRSQGAHEDERVRPWQMLIDFFLAGEHVLLYEPGFDEILDEVPRFASWALLTKSPLFKRRSRWWLNLVAEPSKDRVGKEERCLGCDVDLSQGGIGLFNPKSKREVYDEICCAECIEKNGGARARTDARMRGVFEINHH